MFRLLPSQAHPFQAAWRSYLLAIGPAILLLSVLQLLVGYQGSFLLLHHSWGPFWDLVMPHLTHLADGALVTGVLILLFAKKETPLMTALFLAILLVGIIVMALKQGVFPDWNRPAGVFEEGQVRELSLGKERMFSFPSGHSAAAACLGWFIAGLGRRVWWGILVGGTTCFLAFTRVYLGVHFPGDLLAGLLLGSVIAFASVWVSGWWWNNLEAASPRSKHGWRIAVGTMGALLIIISIVNLLTRYYL